MNKKWLIFVMASAIGCILALGSVASIFGQDSSTEEFTLEEITVTAQKREEDVQKVPITMDVISGDELKELGRNDIDEILANIASVVINTGEDGYRVSIRGMSNDQGVFQGIQASTPTVAVNMDGIYTNRNSSTQGLYDVERVEVLYGPQSTLYASASPGGVVNVVTANPKTDKFAASGTLEYGSYKLLHTEGSINVPLDDKVAIRASFTTSKHDGFLSNGSMDEDRKSARLKALYKPSEKFSIVLTGEYAKTGGQGFSGVTAFADQDDINDPWTSTTSVARLGTDRKTKKISGQMTLDLGYAGTISVVPSYSKTSNFQEGIQTSAPPPGFPGGAVETLNVNSGDGHEKGGEVRMTSSADFPFKWIVGGNIYDSLDAQTRLSYDPADPTTLTARNYISNSQKTRAIYANITYPVTDQFRATGGVRKTWDENKSYGEAWPVPPGRDPVQDFEPQKYSNPNYKIGIEYDIGKNSMLYGDFASSYRTQGMSFWSQQNLSPVPPEELNAFTLGAKNRFFGNKLQLNASVYDYEYKNYFAVGDPHQSVIDANENGIVDPGEGATRQDWWQEAGKRVGDARIYGFDLQTSTIITSKDKLDLSVSYIRKYFKKLFFDWADITNAMGLPDFDYSGKQMPSAPKWSVGASYSHNFVLGNGGSLNAKLDIQWKSSYVLNWQALQVSQVPFTIPVNGQYFIISDTSDVRVQEAYHMTNFSMAYSHPNGAWTLSAYVKNVENYAVKRSLFQGTLMIGDPRTYGGVLSVRF